MFIPPKHIQEQIAQQRDSGDSVRLKSCHLLIDQEIAAPLFKNETSAYLIYYPDRQTLMIAPGNDEVFKQLHKVTQHILKGRNLKGDKSIALHEILIDHQLDETDRDLVFEWKQGMGIMNITI